MQHSHSPATTQAPNRQPTLRRPGLVMGLVLVLTLAACANAPLKSDKLLLARQSVVNATNMGGNALAPAEMQAARERLDYAQTALIAGDLAHADALSDEALANTRLAEIKVQTAKAEKAATELQQARRTLQIEIQKTLK